MGQVREVSCGAGFSVALCANYKVSAHMLTYAHVCSRMLMQRVGQVWAWGSNLAGQLGQGFLGEGRFPHFHEEHPLHPHALLCSRMLTDAHGCSRMLTYAHVCRKRIWTRMHRRRPRHCAGGEA
jgi:hypothetical protein